MTERRDNGPDPSTLLTRAEFAAALTRLRVDAGLTVRQVVEESGCLHGTVSGWFAGHHVPTEPNEKMFRDVLSACGLPDPVAQEAWLAAVRRLRPTTGRRRSQGPVPYRGLQPFHDTDADWFFGRDELTAELHRRVHGLESHSGTPRTLVVIGASGCGKSSVLRAGLMPSLRRAARAVALITPGVHPLRVLHDVAEPVDVVVIDQFEETWSLCSNEDERADFLAAIGAERADGPVYVLGLRADFYAQAAREAVLQHVLAAQSILVGPLSRQALRDVIVEPARKANWTVEDELVQLLLVELAPRGSPAAHDAGALPLLSHALLETWRRSSRRRMTVADYTASGGIASAIDKSAEAVYGGLTEAQQRLARRIFLRLIAIDGENRTRRRVQRGELRYDDDSDDDVATLIDRFAAQRLLTIDADTIEISHEALIAAWARLGDWVDGNQAGLLIHRQLTQAEQLWRDSEQDPSALLGPARLAVIQDWLDSGTDGELNHRERHYITASQQHHRELRARERRRTRLLQRMVAGLAVALIATVVLATVTLLAESSARRARDEAMSRQVALQAQQLRAVDPALSAQLALAAYRVKPTLEARSALLDASATHTPVRVLGTDGGTLVAADDTGTLLAVGRKDATVTVYRLRARTPPTELAAIAPPHPAAVLESLALRRDGGVLAVAFDGRIQLWNVADPRSPVLLAGIGDPAAGYKSITFGADGRTLTAATTNTAVSRWDIVDPAHPLPLAELELPAGAPVIAASPDGHLLAAAGVAGALRLWDLTGPAPRLIVDQPGSGVTGQALAVRFAPDSATLAVAGRTNDVRRWDLHDPAHPGALPALRGFTSYVNDIDFSPDGSRLAAGSSDNTTRIWRLDSDDPPIELPNPVIVVSARFALGGQALVTGGFDGTMRIWPLPGPALSGARSVVFQTPIDRSGTKLLVGTGSSDGHAHFWDLTDASNPHEYPALDAGPDDKPCGAVGLSPDATLAAVGTPSGHVMLWDVHDPNHPVRRSFFPAMSGIVAAIAYTPDNTLMVVLGQDSSIVTLWDIADPDVPRQVAALDAGPGLPGPAAIDPTGTLLVIPTSDHMVRLWDIRRHTEPVELPHPLTGFTNDVGSAAISPNGTLLAAGSMDHTARLFDISNPRQPQPLSMLTGPADAIVTVAFSPDGTRLVGGAGDNGVWVWDVADPHRPGRLAVLNAYRGRINDAAFVLGGRILAAAGPDKVVKLWATDPDQVAAQLCAGGSSVLTPQEWRRYLPGVPPRPLCGDAPE
ncbi:nSTAND1 domain-containing NTPase [Nocardia africana]|uniref:Uncharacterized protein containing caspase domain n=1 Tax=Nocardia africana TaxID=134964 RepID=A0A378WUC0_9NOCA|nr:hypothetical protein [Nocardia africana]MCC3313689.1 hypothetical protein [Nocardia africana]SUA44930.1 Uncharacterized protein containing caspase domain [Nocardia africana]